MSLAAKNFVRVVSSVLLMTGIAVAAETRRDLVVIPQSAQELLIRKDIPVTFKASGFFLAEWNDLEQSAMRDLGIPFEIIYRGVKDDQTFFLFELHQGEEPPAAWQPLFRSGLNVIVAMTDDEALHWTQQGQHAVRLWHKAHGWGNAAQKVAYDCTFNPLIAAVLGKTSQSQWLDWIEKLSGDEPVVIGGTTFTIATRHTATMFSGAANAKGYEFVRQQGQAWNFSGSRFEEDPFTVGPGGKNLVLTIPGQTSSEVLLTAHLDSVFQTGDSTTSAPGANDNGTGIATLLEAARILRQYRFQRTIKIIMFTGEEQGLYGSAAYTQDHPMGPILGVLNLDMFGYDANGDRCFEIHAGTLPASIDVGNCFRDHITTYGMGLTRDFLTSTATNRSDHASFWNVGVGAIEIAENYFNDNQPGGCVGSEPNPFYHTNNDRIATNMTPSYGFSIAKTALATISAMAIPVEACFAAAPAIAANGGTNQVDVSWGAIAGAAKYRVYRGTNGCGGNFVSVGESTGTALIDPITAPGSYAYKIEAVDPDGVCVSVESNCATATPTVYHATPTAVTYVDSCATGGSGNWNGVVEPGESIVMQVTLRNDSNTSLSSIAGTLTSSSAGVTVADPSAAWPNLAPFASAATQPDHFRFLVAPAVACGTTLALQVQATAVEGAWAGPYTVLVGAPGMSNATFPSSDVPKAILDLQTAISTTNVVGPGTVLDVNAQINLTHTWNSDLDIYLRGPDGTLVELSTDNGSSGDNYTNTIFDDEAAIAITAGTSPFAGTYRPEGLLSAFDGRPAAGAWRLEIYDDTSQDTGSLLGWSLHLTTSAAPICNLCAAASSAPGEGGVSAPLTLAKSGADVVFDWGAPPTCTPSGYGVFVGSLSGLAGGYGHDVALTCGASGTSFGVPVADPRIDGDVYFLVAASNATEEGSYGRASSGAERPVSTAACKPAQNLSTCP